MSHASYISELFNPEQLSEQVDKISEIIKEKFPDINYIAGSGISGALILGAVSKATGKRIFCIRKENDDSHSYKTDSIYRDPDYVEKKEKFCEFEDIPEIDNELVTAVIIDDLISSGNTIRRINQKLYWNDILTVGIILYHESGKDYNFNDAALKLEIPVISTSKDMD
jgi:adenine/guanine phosphoribosyltransferase-like PRPP-binding protein